MTEFNTWRSLVDGTVISGIPDRTVLKPESDDLDSFTVEAGTIDSWEINDNDPVFDEPLSLKFSQAGDGTQSILSELGNGLDYYPEFGDAVWIWVQPTEPTRAATLSVMGDNGGSLLNDNVTSLITRDDSEFEMRVDGNETVTSQSFEDKMYLIRIETAFADGDLDVESILHDGPSRDDDVIATLTDTDFDTSLNNDRRVAFQEWGDQDDFVIDRIVADEGGGDPAV